MDFATLYEEDIETWAELQVAALRRLAEMPGPWANAIDIENVIEEIEDLGSSQRDAVQSLLQNAFAHVLKLAADPGSLAVEHWRRELNQFWTQARDKIKPAMRHRIEMQKLWERAWTQAADILAPFDRAIPEAVPRTCPYSFDDVLDPGFDPLTELRAMAAVRPRP
jgi:hypothetical protein